MLLEVLGRGRISEERDQGAGQKSERPAFQRACFRGYRRSIRRGFAGACGTAPQEMLRKRLRYNLVGWVTLEVASGVVGVDAGGGGKLAGVWRFFEKNIVFGIR
jgi:hypothetical protein